MDDIIEVIKKEFKEICRTDKQLMDIKDKIIKGTANFMDISVYARRLGELTRQVIESHYPGYEPHSDELRTFADSIIKDMLKDNYEDVYKKDAAVQIIADKNKKIGIKALKPDFPTERVRTVISAVIAAETNELALRRIVSPMENITASFHDDYIQKNAEFRGKAGLNCYIERTDGHKCCDWCAKLAGKYHYPDEVPKDVYRRHDNCTCDVSYVSYVGRQNVHTKQWTNEQAKAQRIEYANNLAKPKISTPDEARELEAKILASKFMRTKTQS